MSALRICIDGFHLQQPTSDGTAAYAFALANVLRGAGHETLGLFGIDLSTRADLREILFFDSLHKAAEPRRRGKAGLLRQAKLQHVPLTGAVETRALAERLPNFDRIVSAGGLFERALTNFARTGRLVAISMRNPPDVMHWTSPLPLYLRGAANVYSVHQDFGSALVSACARRADRFCVGSEGARLRLATACPGAPDRISVIQAPPLFSDGGDAVAADTDADWIEGVFGLRRRSYFLCILEEGSADDLIALETAFRGSGVATPLVVVGASSRGQGFAAHRSEQVMMVGDISRRLCSRLLRGSRALLVMSDRPGGILAAAEAMRSGTPILAVANGTVAEIADDAAFPVDTLSVERLAAAIRMLDEDTNRRAMLSEAGRRRAQTMSAETCARQLAAMYELAISARGHGRNA